jgi:hypothetical protein
MMLFPLKCLPFIVPVKKIPMTMSLITHFQLVSTYEQTS